MEENDDLPACMIIPYAAFFITLLSGAWCCPTQFLLSRTMAWMIRKSFLDTAMSALILFTKFFPIISIWETEKEDREKNKSTLRLPGLKARACPSARAFD